MKLFKSLFAATIAFPLLLVPYLTNAMVSSKEMGEASEAEHKLQIDAYDLIKLMGVETAAIFAVKGDNVPLLELIGGTAPVGAIAVECYRFSLLHLAARYGALRAAQFLIKSGIDINILNDCTLRVETPLFHAIANGNLGAVKLLLENNANINSGSKIRDNDWESPLKRTLHNFVVTNRFFYDRKEDIKLDMHAATELDRNILMALLDTAKIAPELIQSLVPFNELYKLGGRHTSQDKYQQAHLALREATMGTRELFASPPDDSLLKRLPNDVRQYIRLKFRFSALGDPHATF